jgi:hypothetical protein
MEKLPVQQSFCGAQFYAGRAIRVTCWAPELLSVPATAVDEAMFVRRATGDVTFNIAVTS